MRVVFYGGFIFNVGLSTTCIACCIVKELFFVMLTTCLFFFFSNQKKVGQQGEESPPLPTIPLDICPCSASLSSIILLCAYASNPEATTPLQSRVFAHFRDV